MYLKMKICNILIINLIGIILFLVFPKEIYAQQMTKVSGKIIDASTKEPLPFVAVKFVGKNIGAITDYDGHYSIETQWASNKIEASFLGYEKQTKLVVVGKNQVINFSLQNNDINIGEVVVSSKRKRYKNKNNPAVILIN